MNDELKKLYDVLSSKGYYTKSFDEFVVKYQEPEYRDKLFGVVTRDGLYTKSREEFDVKYPAQEVKKKEEPSEVSSPQKPLASPMETPTSAISKKDEYQAPSYVEGQPLTMDASAAKAVQAQPVTTAPEAAGYQAPTEMQSIGFEPVYQPTISDIVGQVDLSVDEETKSKLGMVFGIGAEVVNRIVAPNSTRGQALSDVNNFVDNTLTAYNVGVLSAQRTNNLADAVPDMERVAYLNKELKKESEKLLSSKMGTSGSDFFTMLASNPVTFLTEVLTTSAVQMTGNVGALEPSDLVIAGGLGAVTGGMGTSAYLAGMNSMNAEMSARIMDELEARGYDINDPKQLEAAFSDKQVMDEVYSKVDAPATVIGLLDALSAGIAGRLAKPIYEVGAQMATGMAGEAAAQVISEGGITNVAGILTEGIAELPGGLVETAFGAKTADIARKAEIKEQIRSVDAAIESEQDPDTKSVLQSLRDNLVREKNKIYSDYVEFVNGLPEDEVEKLNELNEEIVKNNKAIDAVEDPQIKDGLRKRRDALLKEIEQLEQQKPTEDAVQEQAAGEVPVQPEARPGEEVAEGAPQAEPEVTAEAGVEEVGPEVTAEERATIDALFLEAVKPLPNLLINEKGAVPVAGKAKVRRDVVIKAAKMGAQAIASILPNVNIVVHAASEEFVNAVGEDLRGYYDPSTSTIHINMDKAGLSTVAHEIFHAILLDKVKNNDEQAAAVARAMFNSVAKALPKGSSLRIEIEDFAKGYDANIQNEEKISELLGKMASEYRAISKPGRSSIMNFIVKIADSAGFNIGKFTKTDQDVVDLLNTLSVKIREGAEITQEDLAVLEEGGSINIGEPTTINKPKPKGRKRVSFPDKPLPLSFVTKADKIDLMALINEIAENNLKVWFWMADQLGRGEYYDVTSGIMHYLDAGPSFALDPENRKAGVLWASGLAKQTLERNAAEADYIFFISGSPEKAKLFNKNIISIIGTRIEGNGGFAAFKEEALATSKVGALNAILNSVNSVEELRESPKRKAFLNLILEQQSKKTPLVDVLKKYDAFFDPNEFRDSFYAENGFGMKDILLVGKPTGVGGKANHSTYHTEILGEVVGVPDIVLDSWTIMPEELKAKYNKALSNAQQMKTIAGDTGIVRRVETLEKKETDEDSLPVAELTDNQKAALDEFDAKKKPAVRKQKAVSNEEARESLKKKLQKIFPKDTDDALTPDELRVFFMDQNFEYFKGEGGMGSYEQTTKVLMDMASQEGVYLFPSFSLRGAFMFADLANGGETIDMNIMLSPGFLEGPDGMQGNYVDVQAIEALNPGDRGSGAGTRLMNRLVDSADNVGAKLRLEAFPTKRYQEDPVTKKKISQSVLRKTARRLVKFYQRFGFSPYGRTKYNDFQQMRREPLEPGGIVRKVAKPRGRAQILSEFQKASGTTQVSTTTGSYVKAATILKDLGIYGDVLDYGAGLGKGTDAMGGVMNKDVDSLEVNPERWKGKRPVTYTSAEQIDKKYDGIVSLNVLNVVPKDIRDFIVLDIFNSLKDGGIAVISTRGFKGDIDSAKKFELGPEPKSYIIKRAKDGKTVDVFQKGFDGNELVDYISELLKGKAVVKKDNSFGNKGVIIVKGEEMLKLTAQGRKQIIGENAVLSKQARENFLTATIMAATGKSGKQIFAATGWQKGVDDKWRYEIPDGKMIKSSFEFVEGKTVETDAGFMISPSKWTTKYKRLEDLYDSPELYEAYPKLKDFTINFDPAAAMSGSGAYYSPGKDSITINSSPNPESFLLLSYLTHEIQHAIQDIEGFAFGANEKIGERLAKLNKADVKERAIKLEIKKLKDFMMLSQSLSEMYDDLHRKVVDNQDWGSLHIADAFGLNESPKDFYKPERIYDLIKTIYSGTFKKITEDDDRSAKVLANKLYRSYADLSMTTQAAFDEWWKEEQQGIIKDEYPGPIYSDILFFADPLINELKRKEESLEPIAFYKRAAGEVEARNVQERLKKLSEVPVSERPMLFETEDVAAEDQIILFLRKDLKGIDLSEKKPVGRAQRLAEDYIQQSRDAKITDKVIRDFLTRNGFSDDQIAAAFDTIDNAEERLWKEVDGIIKKSNDRRVSRSKTIENVMNYVMGSAVYERATDVKREKLVRDVNKMFGKKQRSAPSVARLFATIKDVVSITVKEKDMLKKQILDQAKGAKDAIGAWRSASVELANVIDALKMSGKISATQAAVAIKKFSSVNVFNEKSVANYVDYMAKVFADADYAKRVNDARKMLPVAKKNVQKKIGISSQLAPALMRLFSIDPNMIPSAMFDSYLTLVEIFGQRAAVLSLPELTSAIDLSTKILDAIDEEYSKVEELNNRFIAYEYKVYGDNGKLDYAATIKQMIEDQTITQEEADLMRKYKSQILERPITEGLSEEEKQEQRDEAIDAINELDVDTERLPTRDERKLAKEIARLAKSDAVKGLTIEQLVNLYKVINNINNGYLPHYAELIKESMVSIENGALLSSAIAKSKPLPFSKAIGRVKSFMTKRGGIAEMIRRNPLAYIDQLFGDFNTKSIFNSVLKAAAEAQSAFESAFGDIQSRLDRSAEAIAKSFKYDGNRTLMSKYKIMTYLLELEYNSNPDNKQVHSAADYLAATIREIKKGKTPAEMGDIDMLQSILDSYADADGNINLEKLDQSFNEAEKKAIKTIQDINSSLTETSVFTAAIIRGDKITPVNNYVHHNVLYDFKSDSNEGMSLVDAYNTSMRPSTKAKSLIERTGKITPLNFDAFASAKRGAKFVLTDYHLTSPIRTARSTFIQAQKNLEEGGITKQQQEILNAIEYAFDEAVTNLLVNNYVENTFVEDAMKWIAKQGYRAMLAGVPRATSEFTSNLSFALFNDPKALSTGTSLFGIITSPDAVEVLNNVGSKQSARLFSGDTINGRFVDTSLLGQSSAVKTQAPKAKLINLLEQGWSRTGKKYKNLVELGADTLISTPDKIVMRPLWFGAFANEFKRITGLDVDFDKIAANDEAYMNEHAEAIEASKELADNRSIQAGASDNAFMGILKGSRKANQSGLATAYNQFNGFMQRFLIYEFAAARTGLYAAVGKGSLTRKQGVALMAAVTSRMVMYTMLSQILGSLLSKLIVGDDEDEEKTFLQSLMQSMMSAFSGLLLGRDFGNIIKAPINYAIEVVNEEYFDFLRKGEYNQYEDSLQFSLISRDKSRKQEFIDIVIGLSGPYSPAFKTAKFAYDKLTDGEKKQVDAIIRKKRALSQRLPLEILGHAGFVPFYKDVRRLLMDDMYKGMGKSKTKRSSMTDKEMKEMFPEMYEEMKSLEKEMDVNAEVKELQSMVKEMEASLE